MFLHSNIGNFLHFLNESLLISRSSYIFFFILSWVHYFHPVKVKDWRMSCELQKELIFKSISNLTVLSTIVPWFHFSLYSTSESGQLKMHLSRSCNASNISSYITAIAEAQRLRIWLKITSSTFWIFLYNKLIIFRCRCWCHTMKDNNSCITEHLSPLGLGKV